MTFSVQPPLLPSGDLAGRGDNGHSTGSTLAEQIAALGPWFHNIHFPTGEQTAPNHPLGDFPRFKWRQIRPHLPADLAGATVLDIGCNAGFYSIELARLGARVTAIDFDDRYLAQARWAAAQFGVADLIDLRSLSVYDLLPNAPAAADLPAQFDIVLFMGVFYHLRHPLLGLDIAAARTRSTLVFQTLTTPDSQITPAPRDLPLDHRGLLIAPGWPRMSFIERKLASDPTNWWVPNAACCEAMLRSAGLAITARPGHEIYLCRPGNTDLSSSGGHAIVTNDHSNLPAPLPPQFQKP